MRIKLKHKSYYLNGSVLPATIVISCVMTAFTAGLLALWSQEKFVHAQIRRLRQAKADIESAVALYCRQPGDISLTAKNGYQLYDSLPMSRVYMRTEPWGLYELLHVVTKDSLVSSCRLLGVAPDPKTTLWLADDRTTLTLAGQSEVKGTIYLPQNGLVYGRMNTDFFQGRAISGNNVKRSDSELPAVARSVEIRLDSLFNAGRNLLQTGIPDSLSISFHSSETIPLKIEDAEIGDCRLWGRIVLYGEELRIDSTCRMMFPIVVARKITVGSGSRITAQLFARDSVIMEPRSTLEYPSGIWSGRYAALLEQARIDGYVIIRDTVTHRKPAACYRQNRTARVRGLLRADGAAQVQGLITGQALLHQLVYFSPRGYYKGMLYDATLLENPLTAFPLGCGAGTKYRKEVSELK